MRLRRAAHRSVGGARSLGFFEGAVKAILGVRKAWRSENENLAPSGTAHIIVLTQWINSYRHWLAAASAVMPALASSQGPTRYGQNDCIEFRRATVVLHV